MRKFMITVNGATYEVDVEEVGGRTDRCARPCGCSRGGCACSCCSHCAGEGCCSCCCAHRYCGW